MIEVRTPADAMLFSTMRVEADRPDGSTGCGTAFVLEFDLGEGKLPVLITNKHVVKDAHTGRLHVHVETLDGTGAPTGSRSFVTVTVENFEAHWLGHPGNVDLCAMPILPLLDSLKLPNQRAMVGGFTEAEIASVEQLAGLSVLEDVVMIGYPIGLWDQANNLPIVRRGVTASHPVADFNGKPEAVVDIASFPGSSGSPVVIYNNGAFHNGRSFQVGTRKLLLGVLYAGPMHTAAGDIAVVDIPTVQVPFARTEIPMHLGYYVKARELIVLKEELRKVLKV